MRNKRKKNNEGLEASNGPMRLVDGATPGYASYLYRGVERGEKGRRRRKRIDG